MRAILLIDPLLCDGCGICQTACSLMNDGECNPEKSRVRVIRDVFNSTYTPIMCLHCEKPFCKEICPVKAIHHDPETGIVSAPDEKTCIGCKLCLYVCPIGAPSFSFERNIMVKCDLCKGDPACVKFCPRKSLQYLSTAQSNIVKKRDGARKLMQFQNMVVGKSAAKEH